MRSTLLLLLCSFAGLAAQTPSASESKAPAAHEVPPPALAADSPTAAETAYAKGDYAGAVDAWIQELRLQGITAGRLSALGNAEWRLGRKGRAMLCWARALRLDPHDPVALAGVRHALGSGGVSRPASTWAEGYASILPNNVWWLIALVSFWTALLCIVIPRWRRRSASAKNHRARMIALTVLALCLPGIWGIRTLEALAVVRRPEVSLRLTPTQLGEKISSIAEGDIVRIERLLNKHHRVSTAQGKTGWVRVSEVEKINHSVGLPSDLEEPAAP